MFRIITRKTENEILAEIEKVGKSIEVLKSRSNNDKVVIAHLRKRIEEISADRDRYKAGVNTLTRTVKELNQQRLDLKREVVKDLQSIATSQNAHRSIVSFIKKYKPLKP